VSHLKLLHGACGGGMVRASMQERPRDIIIEHPNRDKASSKSTKAIVILLLVASAALIAVITIGGWDALQGAQPVQIAYVGLYVVMAYFVLNWNRGVLPVTAAMAIIMLIFAAVAAPDWFARDKDGYTDPALSAEMLGMLTLVVIPIQALLIAFAMRGFGQGWNVEVERRQDGSIIAPASDTPARGA
jgi:Mg2+/Co2+ transporter CorB